MSRTSTPSTSTEPPVASNSRGISEISVVLPAPVEPMIAVVWPGRAVKVDVAQHGSLRAGVGELGVVERPPWTAVGQGWSPARAGGTTEDSVSSTSSIRSAQTAARGASISKKVAIITDIRIWIR